MHLIDADDFTIAKKVNIPIYHILNQAHERIKNTRPCLF